MAAPSRSLERAAAGRLEAAAGQWGCSPAQLALAWVLNRPAVASAIIGPETAAELGEVIGAVELGTRLSPANTTNLTKSAPPE